jgi:hypothetical protein
MRLIVVQLQGDSLVAMNLNHLIKGPRFIEDLVKRRYLRVQDLNRLSEAHCFKSQEAYMSRHKVQ